MKTEEKKVQCPLCGYYVEEDEMTEFYGIEMCISCESIQENNESLSEFSF